MNFVNIFTVWKLYWFVDDSVVFRYFGACRLGFNPLEKLLFYEMDFEIYVFNKWLRNMVIKVFFSNFDLN